MTKLFNNVFIACDAPRPWGIYFQDSASPQMEALVELHDNIMFYLVIILFGVAWILVSIIRNYVNDKFASKYLNHGTLIELIWTITPALILILIAFPSFKLLYLMDEVIDPSLTVFVEGHQWYWSYQYPDFVNDDLEELEFDCYLVPESDLEQGGLRLLEVDNRVILPEPDYCPVEHVLYVETEPENTPSTIPTQKALIKQQEINQAYCVHASFFPYPEDGVTPIMCDLNPVNGVKHDAFRGGVSPTVCGDCHLIICRDCSNPDYNSDSE